MTLGSSMGICGIRPYVSRVLHGHRVLTVHPCGGVSESPSFSRLSSTPLWDGLPCVCPFIPWWTSGLLLHFSYHESCCYEHGHTPPGFKMLTLTCGCGFGRFSSHLVGTLNTKQTKTSL